MGLTPFIVLILNLLPLLTTASTPAPFPALVPFHPLTKRQAQTSICHILPDVGTRIGESTCGSGVVFTSANCICCPDGVTPCQSVLQSCQCSGSGCACVDKYNLVSPTLFHASFQLHFVRFQILKRRQWIFTSLHRQIDRKKSTDIAQSGDCASQGLASCGSKCMPQGQVCCNSDSYCPAGYECCSQGGVMNCCPTSSSGSAATSAGGPAAATSSPGSGEDQSGPSATAAGTGSSSQTGNDGRKNVPLLAELGIGLMWWLL